MKQSFVKKIQATVAAIRYHHPARSLKVIAVAGAYGKSTTARLLSELLQEAGQQVFVLTSGGSWHNQQALSVRFDSSAMAVQRCLAMAKRKNANVVIVECSDDFMASCALSTMPIEMAIITSDSEDAKALLKQPMKYLVMPSDVEIISSNVSPHQTISYGIDEQSEARQDDVRLFRKGTEVDITIDHQTNVTLASHLIGYANARNITAAVAAAYLMSVPIDVLPEGVARLLGVGGNFEYLTIDRPFTAMVDGAVHSESLEKVLKSADKLKKRRLLVALDGTISDYETVKRYADWIEAMGEGEDLVGVAFQPTLAEVAKATLKGAKKDDLVLFLGRDFASLTEDGNTLAQQIIGGDNE